jgi:TonB family protein
VKIRVSRRRSFACIPRSLSILAVVLSVVLGGGPSVSAQNAPKVHRKVMVSVQPQYPTILQKGRFEGQVRLEATVQPNGNVSRVEVKGGNPMLCQYASEAVMHWKYAPGPNQTVEDIVFNFDSSRH